MDLWRLIDGSEQVQQCRVRSCGTRKLSLRTTPMGRWTKPIWKSEREKSACNYRVTKIMTSSWRISISRLTLTCGPGWKASPIRISLLSPPERFVSRIWKNSQVFFCLHLLATEIHSINLSGGRYYMWSDVYFDHVMSLIWKYASCGSCGTAFGWVWGEQSGVIK